MHVQTHLLHALTQTYLRQVCRWSESNAQVNNRVTSPLKVCAQKDARVLRVHLSVNLYMFSSHSAPTKEQVPANGGDLLSHGSAVDCDWCVPIDPQKKDVQIDPKRGLVAQGP